MQRTPFILAGFIAVLSGCGRTEAPTPPASTSRSAKAATVEESGSALAPAVNWVLPIFTDKEGHRSMTLRGSSIQPQSNGNIGVSDLSITIFDGSADAKVDSILLAPQATFFPKENVAQGERQLRFIQDNVEVNGTGWEYTHAARKLSIHRNVRVTFRAQLNDILK